MKNLEEIKTAIEALSLEEQNKLLLFLENRIKELAMKNSEPRKTSTEEMDAWADAEAGSARFEDGR